MPTTLKSYERLTYHSNLKHSNNLEGSTKTMDNENLLRVRRAANNIDTKDGLSAFIRNLECVHRTKSLHAMNCLGHVAHDDLPISAWESREQAGCGAEAPFWLGSLAQGRRAHAQAANHRDFFQLQLTWWAVGSLAGAPRPTANQYLRALPKGDRTVRPPARRPCRCLQAVAVATTKWMKGQQALPSNF